MTELKLKVKRICQEREFLYNLCCVKSKKQYRTLINNATENQLDALVDCMENYNLFVNHTKKLRIKQIEKFKNTVHKQNINLRNFILKQYFVVKPTLEEIFANVTVAEIMLILLDYGPDNESN